MLGGGGGNVNDPVTPPCDANYLSKWVGGGYNIHCSHVWENTSSPYFVGIGPGYSTGNEPTRQLQVNGDIDIPVMDSAHYQITGQTVLSIDGGDNVFVGAAAGPGGSRNVFVGGQAGFSAATGNTQDNTIIGYQAGHDFNDGLANIIIGSQAGYHFASGNANILLDNSGVTGENFTTRIGERQDRVFLAGDTASVSGSTACISGTNQLGICGSSRRFKEQIQDMGNKSSAFMKLRPVTFFYRPEYDEGPRALQFGLVAEEVAEVYPDLVTFDSSGKPLSIRYQNVTSMLVNELQKQYRSSEAQARLIGAQQQQLEAQEHRVVTQQQEIECLKALLQLQNATFQERLSRVESLVGTSMKTAADMSSHSTMPTSAELH